MNNQLIIAATTAAVATKVGVNTGGYEVVMLAADNLAGAETCPIFISVNGNWVALNDSSGTAVKLTATKPTVSLQGGPRYGVTKDATAGACAVTAIWQGTPR